MGITIIDTVHSRGRVNMVRIVVALAIKRQPLGVKNVAKDTTRSIQILTSTSRASLMSQEGQTMMTCGDMNKGDDFVHNVLYRLREANLGDWGLWMSSRHCFPLVRGGHVSTVFRPAFHSVKAEIETSGRGIIQCLSTHSYKSEQTLPEDKRHV